MPAPLLPMMAVVVPSLDEEGEVGEHGARRARVVEAGAAELDLGGRRGARPVTPEASTLVLVSSTSWARRADTAARGIIETMKVAITTDMRICSR